MFHAKTIYAFTCVLLSLTAAATSPNGAISCDIKGDSCIVFSYNYSSAGNKVPLLTLDAPVVEAIGSPARTTTAYTMPTGKRSVCANAFEEQLFRLADSDTLAVRLYNDGFAWRQSAPSTIAMAPFLNRWTSRWTDSYENFFPCNDSLPDGQRIAYPALFEYADGIFALISESGIERGTGLTSMYACGGEKYILRTDGDCRPGWQTVIAGPPAQVVESTLITDNSPECAIGDTAWIHPGVAAWIYWAHNHGSNDMNIIRQYVDLAADLHLPYVLIDAEWDEMKDGYTIDDALAYAHSKNIAPIIWYNSSVGWVDGAPGPKYRLNSPEDLEKEFTWCEKMGVKGVKVDFFSGDEQHKVDFMLDLFEAAARHNMLINVHGVTLPRGWNRTYPNLVSAEAVYGAEWYNNKPVMTNRAAAHNATLPFTRNIVGPMDYTPCAFSDSQYPHITTHAHELALTVLYESGVQHIADRPESLLAQPTEVQNFFGQLPAAWTDTRLLGGYPGRYVALARRAPDGAWWIGIINGTDEEIDNMSLDLSRLELPEHYRAEVFADGDPWQITRTLFPLPDTITLRPRGGMVIVIRP